MRMRIIVAPTEIKVAAARHAARRALNDLVEGDDIDVVVSQQKPPSTVPDQPLELVEAHVGAFARTVALLDEDPDATHALGIESAGAYVGRGHWVDLAVISLVDRAGREVVTTSAGVPMPAEDLGRAIAAPHRRTAGSFIAERAGCDGADWQRATSGGLLPREEILADAAYAAIVWAARGSRS